MHPSSSSPQWLCGDMPAMDGEWWIRQWPSIAGMLAQSHCGDEEDGRIGLPSWRHYICIYINIYVCVYIHICIYIHTNLINYKFYFKCLFFCIWLFHNRLAKNWFISIISIGGRRGAVSLRHILKFVTGTDEEPVLGFTLHPSITFVEVESESKTIPTASRS